MSTTAELQDELTAAKDRESAWREREADIQRHVHAALGFLETLDVASAADELREALDG